MYNWIIPWAISPAIRDCGPTGSYVDLDGCEHGCGCEHPVEDLLTISTTRRNIADNKVHPAENSGVPYRLLSLPPTRNALLRSLTSSLAVFVCVVWAPGFLFPPRNSLIFRNSLQCTLFRNPFREA